MQLVSSSSNSFFKFKTVGDKIAGQFVSFKERQPGRFGEEDVLVLAAADGPTTIVCKTHLSRIISENRDALPGQYLSIEYVGEQPSSKGNPMKLFRVDVLGEAPF